MRNAQIVASSRSINHPRGPKKRRVQGRDRMQWHLGGRVALTVLGISLAGVAAASDNKIAVAPGGPHPYFAPWEQAAADAQKDFGIAAVDYKVPADWKLELQTELLERPRHSGLQGFWHLPRRSRRHQHDHCGAEGRRYPVRRARRMYAGPERRRLLLRDGSVQHLLRAGEGSHQGDGRQG